jgi:hypothetical protein
MKTIVALAILLAASASCASGQEKRDLKHILKQRGQPSFTARSVHCEGHLLACHKLDVFVPGEGKSPDTLRGKVLLYCKPWDGLWLWAAHVGQDMARAAPFVGRERPGAKVWQELPVKAPPPTPLPKPARVWIAYIDKQGIARLTVEVTVSELTTAE